MPSSCSWVKVNDTLLDSIGNMDKSLADDEFGILLEELPTKNKDDPHSQTLSFLVDRSQKFTMNSEQFYNDLIELGLSNNKAGLLQKHWTDRLKPVLNNLSLDGGGEINELSGLSWNVEVEMVSSGINRTQRNKTPLGVINLRTTQSEAANLELDHAGLLHFCNKIEEIQKELDTIRMNS